VTQEKQNVTKKEVNTSNVTSVLVTKATAQVNMSAEEDFKRADASLKDLLKEKKWQQQDFLKTPLPLAIKLKTD